MADIRINSLPSTATSFNTDDYIAIDGASAGTRRMLAANPPFSDVTLGTSGPSVKSTLSARAARQGLVFDGTAGATVASVPAFGTGDFTVSVWVRPNSLSVGYETYIVGGATGCFALRMENTTGLLSFLKIGGGLLGTSSSGLTAGKWALVTLSRSSGSNQFYINGVAIGSAISNSADYTVATTQIGNTASVYPWVGGLSPLIYNRALSAAEVVALYEAGVPAGSDYPTTAAGTDNVTNGNFSSSTGWAVGSAWTISGGVATTNGTGDGGGATELAQTGKSFKAGQRVRVTYTLASVTSGSFRIIFYGGTSNVFTTTRTSSGTYTEEITLTGGATAFQTTSGVTALNNGATLDNLSIVSLGLLLAPDAGQAGGGLTWYDTSGNAANITLPASGVSWNVPTSGKMATSLTIGGTGTGLTLSPTSGPATLAINGPGAGSAINYQLSGTNKYTAEYVSSSDFYAIGRSGVAYDLVLKSGNALFGTTTDSSNGRVQLATHTTSAGGIGFGTDVSFYRKSAALMGLNGSGGAKIDFHEGGTLKGGVGTYAGSMYVVSDTTSPILFYTNASLALTLDSSQNATFAGAIKAGSGGQVTIRSISPAIVAVTPTTNLDIFDTNDSATRLWRASNEWLQIAAARGGFTGQNNVFLFDVVGPNASQLRPLKFRQSSDGGTTFTDVLTLDTSANATFAGNIKTAAPSGGTAATWRLGTVATVSPTSPNRTIEVEIGGTTYYIHAKTTNN
jgi:hypothetical protein